MKRCKVQAAIALGSNLGNSQQILLDAVTVIAQTPDIEVLKCSSWYQTKAIGPPQPDYLNGCLTIYTSLSPEQLLQTLLAIEEQFGRERKIRWGARTLDLDLIFYGDLILETKELQIPHPRMSERAFVLEPLAEIAPDWLDPVTKRSVSGLLSSLRQKLTIAVGTCGIFNPQRNADQDDN